MGISGKIFAVTGGASGMGAATARLLAQKGAKAVCVADISKNSFADLKASISNINSSTEVHCSAFDVASSAGVDNWIQSIVAKYGNLHGAANVAGIPQGAGLREPPAIVGETNDMWHKILKVNLDGVFYCTRAEVAAMSQLPPAKRSIVNVASIAASRHMPDIYAYNTSKAACLHFSQSVAHDAWPFGIRVNTVSPGATKTPMLSQFVPTAKTQEEVKTAFSSMGLDQITAEDVARTIVWLLDEDSSPVYGANINVGAGIP